MARISLKKIPVNSNGLYLYLWELLAVAIVVLTLVWGVLPLWHRQKLQVTLPENFRFSYQLRDDYLLYRAMVREACSKYDNLFLGDSVIWGMYVRNDSTLPALINQKLGKETCGNIAIDGLHPIAMEGLMKQCANEIHGKRVFLYFNPLWVTSQDYDLTGEGTATVNHPRLLPQFDFSLTNYHGTLKERCNAKLEQMLDFYAMLHHLRVCFYDNRDFKTYIAKHPDENPLSRIRMELSPIEEGHTSNATMDWYESGIAEQNWPWIDLTASRQFQAFRNTALMLRQNGNEVVVLLGTINPFMQNPECLERYRKLMAQAEELLSQAKDSSGNTLVVLPELPSEEYGDSSHPLMKGYDRLADFLISKGLFQQ